MVVEEENENFEEESLFVCTEVQIIYVFWDQMLHRGI